MSRRLAAVVCAAGLVATACGERPQAEAAIVGPTWTVTDAYREPGAPSALPPTVAGSVTMSFGESSVTATTGCGQLQAVVTFVDAGKPARAQDADALTVEDAELSEAGDCDDSARRVHSLVTEMFATGETLDFSPQTHGELLISMTTHAVDNPSLRLATL